MPQTLSSSNIAGANIWRHQPVTALPQTVSRNAPNCQYSEYLTYSHPASPIYGWFLWVPATNRFWGNWVRRCRSLSKHTLTSFPQLLSTQTCINQLPFPSMSSFWWDAEGWEGRVENVRPILEEKKLLLDRNLMLVLQEQWRDDDTQWDAFRRHGREWTWKR